MEGPSRKFEYRRSAADGIGIGRRRYRHTGYPGVSEPESNELSVRQELQADCLAGVWANHAQDAKQILEPGDVDEALGAASAVGDDRLQQQSQGFVVPDSFTHGTAQQRSDWFMRGFQSDSPETCDTFG